MNEPTGAASPVPQKTSGALIGGALALGCLGMILFALGAALLVAGMRMSREKSETVVPQVVAGQEEPAAPSRGILSRVTGALGGGGRPAKAGFRGGRPAGLYFMTRFWAFTGSLEKKVWYFASDGTAYEGLATGFSAADLDAHIYKRL